MSATAPLRALTVPLALVLAAACGDGSLTPDPGGDAEPDSLGTRLLGSAAPAAEAADSLSARAVSAGGDEILDVELALPAEISVEGASHPAPDWESLTLRSLLSAVEEHAAEITSLEPATASEERLAGAADEALRLQLTLVGVALQVSGRATLGLRAASVAQQGPPALRRGSIFGAMGDAATNLGDLKCTLRNADYFASDPSGAAGRCDISSGVNLSLGAQLGFRDMVEVMLNRLAGGGFEIQEVEPVAQAMADQASADGEDGVLTAVQAYRDALDSDPYYQRSADLEGGVLTFLNGTLPDATSDLIDELWTKLEALSPNSPPTVHQELQDLTSELRESALLGSYQSTTSAATGFQGVAEDAYTYLAPIESLAEGLESRKGDVDAALAAVTPSPELAARAEELDAAHDTLVAHLEELDEDLAREQAYVAPLTGRITEGYEKAVGGAGALGGSP